MPHVTVPCCNSPLQYPPPREPPFVPAYVAKPSLDATLTGYRRAQCRSQVDPVGPAKARPVVPVLTGPTLTDNIHESIRPGEYVQRHTPSIDVKQRLARTRIAPGY